MARPPSKKGASRKRAGGQAATRKGQTTSKTQSSAKRGGSAKKAASAPKAIGVQRPPEIPAAQWAKLGQGQRKRYAGFYKKHPGRPLYEARGKKAGEHLTRKQRLQARLAAFAARQARRKGIDAAAFLARLEAAVASPRGEGWFGKYERLISARNAEWTAAGSPRKGDPKALGNSLDAMMGQLDDEGVDWEWEADDLFYH